MVDPALQIALGAACQALPFASQANADLTGDSTV
jgi:hypothetical protein